jgi:hypothetical protein
MEKPHFEYVREKETERVKQTDIKQSKNINKD